MMTNSVLSRSEWSSLATLAPKLDSNNVFDGGGFSNNNPCECNAGNEKPHSCTICDVEFQTKVRQCAVNVRETNST